jgi:hypothetical protein
MKKYIHPQLTQTIVRYKDGSTQGVFWTYLRPSLILEASSKKMIELRSGKNYSASNESTKPSMTDSSRVKTIFWDN